MQIKNFAFFINKLDNSHPVTTMSHNLNLMLYEHFEYNPTVFHKTSGKVLIYPQFPHMMMQHIYSYEGIVISTDIDTTKLLGGCMRTTRKIFYVFDLEWLYLATPQFGELQKIYQNPDIELLARCQVHYDILKRVWKQAVTTL